jgi:hypothetical protein
MAIIIIGVLGHTLCSENNAPTIAGLYFGIWVTDPTTGNDDDDDDCGSDDCEGERDAYKRVTHIQPYIIPPTKGDNCVNVYG